MKRAERYQRESHHDASLLLIKAKAHRIDDACDQLIALSDDAIEHTVFQIKRRVGEIIDMIENS